MSAQTQQHIVRTAPRAVAAAGPNADAAQKHTRILSVIAISSLGAGAINVAAAATVGRANIDTLAFFVAVAAAQIAWGAIALVRASRWWLALGAVGNLAVVATWLTSRTVGLPAGSAAGITLPVGFPDGLATALEIAVVLGAASLTARWLAGSRAVAGSPRVTMATALVVGVLALAGVLVQTGAISSAPSSDGGGGGAPTTPAGGGGYNY
jgi:hypothetical protein